MSAARTVLFVFLILAFPCLALEQGFAWEYTDPVPRSDGTRATLSGFPFPEPYDQPGYSPRALVSSEDGAYLILPINGASTRSGLDSIINPSWWNVGGYQVLRLDLSGQVVWKRFWAFALAPIGLQYRARLTRDGGLAIGGGRAAAHFSPNGDAHRVDEIRLPGACDLGDPHPIVTKMQVNSDGDIVVTFTGRLSNRACALSPTGDFLESVEAPPAQEMDVVDFRRGVGFLVSTYTQIAGDPSPQEPKLRLRQGALDRWLISDLPWLGGGDLVDWLSVNGDAWLPEFDGQGSWRIIAPDGTQLAQLSALGDRSVLALLGNGDALIGNRDLSDMSRVTPEGEERWRTFRVANSEIVGELQPFGDSVRVLTQRFEDGRAVVHTINLEVGSQRLGSDFALGGLAAGPLGMGRHVSASSGAPETTWSGDLCVGCRPNFVSLASTLDVRVFESDTGAAIPGPAPTGFGFPTYARLRERSPAVAREPNTLETAHARYVSTGEKEVLEVTRLSSSGNERWQRRLEFPRIDVADAKVEIVNDLVYVAATGRGPVRQAVHRLWALGSQGSVLWERELSVPYSQLARVFVGGRYVLCGLGETRGNGGLPPSWHCYRSDGVLEVDTTLAFTPQYRAIEISHVLGDRVHLRVVEPEGQSAASIRFFEIDGYANLIAQPVWQIDETDIKGLVRIDAIVRRDINLVSAPVYDSVDAFDASELLVAAFDSGGRRLWQRRIEQPLRASWPSHTHTALDTDGGGIVHIAFSPRLGLDEFPLRVCRLSANDGSLIGCADTPLYGRVGAVFATTDPPASWMWANQTQAAGGSALTLFPLTVDGIGAPIYQQVDLQLRLAGSVTGRSDRSWAVVEPASYMGVFEETSAPTTRVLLFQPGLIVADGFESVP